MAALHITKENFESEVLNSDKPVLIDFWASWCMPCKILLPVIEELSEEVTNAKICKINVDEQQSIASAFNIMSIPTLVVMKDGKIISKAVGVQSKDAIKNMLNI